MSRKDMKVCLLGSMRVGKTSITTRFVEGTFDKNYKSSIGVSFLAKTLYFQNVDYRFALWDTAGQERFRSLVPLTYRSATAALIVYDITNQDSFDEVEFWLSELRRDGGEEIWIYVVGNKVDLESDRVVVQQSAESYAQAKGAFHFQTSAKTGQGIEEIFYDICQMELNASSILRNRISLHRKATWDISNLTNDKEDITDGQRSGCRCPTT